MGFIIEDEAAAIVIPSDTGPTDEIWRRANELPHLKAVFLETCFPNAMADVAARAEHLTPATFALEVRKITRPASLIAMHVKPLYYAQVVEELRALGLPNLTMARFGEPYQF